MKTLTISTNQFSTRGISKVNGVIGKKYWTRPSIRHKRDYRPIIRTPLMSDRQNIVETDRNKAKQTSQTLFRGLKILELTASGKSNRPIRELAKELKLPRSIVHRLIATLESEGYIQKNSANPGYRLGTKLWSLGCAAIQGLEITEVARPYLEDLSSKTNELVALGVLDG